MNTISRLIASLAMVAFTSVSHAALYDISVNIDGTVSGGLNGTVTGSAIGTFDSLTNQLLFSGNYNLVVPSVANIDVGTDWNVNGLTGTQTATSCSSSGLFNLCTGVQAFNIPPLPLNQAADMGLTANTVIDGFGNLTAGFTLGSGSNLTYVDIDYAITGSLATVPVPAAAWLFASSLVGLVGLRRKHSHKA